jgi:hypothetical protein
MGWDGRELQNQAFPKTPVPNHRQTQLIEIEDSSSEDEF